MNTSDNSGDVVRKLSNSVLFQKYFGAYCILVIDLFGLAGNFLTIYIFIRQRKRTGAMAVYFVCLAVSDAGNLMFGLFTWSHTSLFYITNGRVNIPLATQHWHCRIRLYLHNVFVAMSGYIIVAFSAERAIAVWAPLKAVQIVTTRRRIGVLIFMLIYSATTITLYIPVIYNVTKIMGGVERQGCQLAESQTFYDRSVQFIQTLHFYSPCFLIVLLNICIVVGIAQARNEKLTTSVKLRKLESRLIVNLLLVSIVYVLTIGTHTTFRKVQDAFIHNGLPSTPAIRESVSEMASLISMLKDINYSVNFVIYALSLKFYRESIRAIFCWWRERGEPERTSRDPA